MDLKHSSVLSALVLAVVAITSSGSDASAAQTALRVGGTARINFVGSNTLCYPTIASMHAQANAVKNQDSYGLTESLANTIMLDVGTPVRAIDSAESGSVLKLRIEGGDYEGRACWYPSDPQNFKDVMPPQ